MVQDKLGPIAKLVALPLILLSLQLCLLSIFLKWINGNQVFKNKRHKVAKRAPQVLIEELNGLKTANLEYL